MRRDIDIITLGCSKNLVDTERVMGMLSDAGFVCHHDPEQPSSPIAVINTCGFIGDAKEESIACILRMAARKQTAAKKSRKEEGTLEKLYVMGCLSQRYREELAKEIPEVDGWYGKFDFEELVTDLSALGAQEVHKGSNDPRTTVERLSSDCRVTVGRLSGDRRVTVGESPIKVARKLTTPTHYAYLKISEGCNRMCSYCAIPLITGRHTSRPMEDILDEVRWLVSQGVKEVNVIAQDLSSYGLDSEKKHLLPKLVDKMAQIEGVEWIRLHYAYPTDFPWELLPVMAKHTNVCKYLDIALQHSSDHVLGLMRRHITCAEQEEVINRIRREVPGICIRTTLLVGHPGETEEDFEELKAWVRKMRFDRMGAFAYSDEDGTYANLHYQDDVPSEVKQARVDELMAIQQQISAELMQEKVGQTMRVIIDREEEDYYVGRTEFDSPEVDCEVLIEKGKVLKVEKVEKGEFYNIKIIKAEEFDLYGELC